MPASTSVTKIWSVPKLLRQLNSFLFGVVHTLTASGATFDPEGTLGTVVGLFHGLVMVDTSNSQATPNLY